MEISRLCRALLAMPGLSFRTKALILAAIASLAPFAVLAFFALGPAQMSGRWPELSFLGMALAASLLALLALRSLLSAIEAMTDAARASAVLAGGDAKAARADEVLSAMGDIKHVAGRLQSVSHRLAHRHPVTGVATREPLLVEIAKDVAREDRTAALLGVIRLAQFDRLAAVDRPSADAALRAFAQRLSKSLAGARPLAQVDRDAFAVWFNDTSGPRGAAAALKRLAGELCLPLVDGDVEMTPDVRVGAAVFPDDGVDGPALLARAMSAVGKAERMSPGRIAYYSEESSADAEARHVMEQALRQAIFRRELALFYQPVIDLTNGRVVGAEALLRWRHPELGSIPPAQFLPVLERSGLIDEVGRWVLDAACLDARTFEGLGLPGFRVGVNLSERQFRDPHLASMVTETLRRHDLKPQRLELELTEASLMHDLKHTRRTFETLSDIGVGIAIDDYGAGASSLGDLKDLRFSKLKIDRAFVTEVSLRHDSQAVCAALIELGRRLDIAVLAEGVETREEVEALRMLGCGLFQGFFFARPLPADKFIRKVADADWLALISAPARRDLADVGERLAS
jgi:Amt family ammonium transporter